MDISRIIGIPKFAPNGRDFAVLVEGFNDSLNEQLVRARQDESDQIWSVLNEQDGNCLMAYLEGASC